MLTLRTERTWALGAVLVAAVSVATMVTHGWVPIDEGTIVLPARMVAAGYLPHADFAYPYTGALPVLNAIAMQVGSDSMLAPRIMLLGAFLAWLPFVWMLARRYAGPPVAALAVILGASWSLLIYPAATPTWYILFLTTWALVALARWGDGAGSRWLLFTGVLCGLAMVVKQTGVYTLAACGLGILGYVRARTGAAASAPTDVALAGRRVDTIVVLLLIGVGLVPLSIVARRGLGPGDAILIALPALAVITSLVVVEVRGGGHRGGARRPLFSAWGMLAVGSLIPVAMMIAWYAWNDALPALWQGAISNAVRTAGVINRPLPPSTSILGLGLPVFAAAWATGVPRSARVRWVVGTACAVAAAVAASIAGVPAYRAVWYFALLIVPAGTLAVLEQSFRAVPDERGRAHVMALAAATALMALNQYPYAAPNYFGYVAPLAIILLLAVGSLNSTRQAADGQPGWWRPWVPTRSPFMLVLLLLFGAWLNRIGSVTTVGSGAVWSDDVHRLPGAHAGIRVTQPDSARYARVLELISDHGGGEGFIAGPELPELYVLAGTERLVRQPYLLIDGGARGDGALMSGVDTTAIQAVVINHLPAFLPQVGPETMRWITARYPASERVGDIEVRWR